MSSEILSRIAEAEYAQRFGTVTAIGRGFLAANGPRARVGEYCGVGTEGGALLAEVVSVTKEGLRLSPLASTESIALGAKVVRVPGARNLLAGDSFAGRAIDGLAKPIDGRGPITSAVVASRNVHVDALDRTTSAVRFVTGVRAVDGLLPLARGQRVGIFAASGAGKTSLVEQLLDQAEFDHAVVCLVGERGREVTKFWASITSGSRGDRISLVAATADESAAVRVRTLDQALALAEHWRAKGRHVLLLVDSITRVAMALREVGFAAGEPPSARGYTANVFTNLPGFVERCGGTRSGGAITAIMTVLSETDDVDDPVVELMKSVLDGHIVLARALAERRHYPAIDIARSVSRLSGELLSGDQAALADAAFRLHATFEEARPMIESGLYAAGSNPEIDRAIEANPRLVRFLQQTKMEACPLERTERELSAAVGGARNAH